MPRRFVRRKRRFKKGRRKIGIVKIIKKVLHSEAEHKFHDANDTSLTLTMATPSFITSLNNIAGGTDFNLRVGIKCLPSRLKIRYGINLTDAGNDFSTRVYVIQSFTDVAPSSMPDITGFMPPLRQSLVPYRVLFDRTFEQGLGISQDKFRDINIPMKKMLEMAWESSLATSQVRGLIQIHFVTSNTTAGDLSLQLFSRLYYTDV